MYHYGFDHNPGGSFRISRERYEIERDSLRLLLTKVDEWNRIAVEHGAVEEPYSREARDLRNMISSREERLNDAERPLVFMENIQSEVFGMSRLHFFIGFG